MVDEIAEKCGQKWAILFKAGITLVCGLLPWLVGLMLWQTQQIYSLLQKQAVSEATWQAVVDQGIYTHKDAASDRAEIRVEIGDRIQKWANEADRIYIRKADR